jgi:hypothetical protein
MLIVDAPRRSSSVYAHPAIADRSRRRRSIVSGVDL